MQVNYFMFDANGKSTILYNTRSLLMHFLLICLLKTEELGLLDLDVIVTPDLIYVFQVFDKSRIYTCV